MTCWCWSSFWIGIAAAASVLLAPGLIVLIGCMMAAPELDENGNLIVKVHDAG